MLSLLLITALALQYPPPASHKPATDTTARHRAPASSRSAQSPSSMPASRDTNKTAVGRAAFHDRMRELWSDNIVYTRGLIVAATSGQADTAEVLQRLLRNQDEIADAVKPYYGDAAGTQLAALLRTHIQLAGKAVAAAKGNRTTAMQGMNGTSQSESSTAQNQTSMAQNQTSRIDTTTRNDSSQLRTNSQYPTTSGRMDNDTSRARRSAVSPADTTKSRSNAQYPTAAGRMNDTTRAQSRTNPQSSTGVARTGDTTRMQENAQNNPMASTYAQGQGQTDSTALNQAITALRANGDSIADFLAQQNPRGFTKETLRGAIQMHVNLLLQEVTAQVQKDYSGSIAAFDESLHQASQMADLLSDGIIKQFPSRFTNKATNVSTR